MNFDGGFEDNTILTSFAFFSTGLACGWMIKGSSAKFSTIKRLLAMKGKLAPSMRDTKMVMIVRSDLGMSHGKIASQCAHAAVACYEIARGTEIADRWTSQGQPKVVLKQEKGEFGLLELQRHAKSLGVACTVVRDAGKTQVAAGSATVLGIGPADVDQVDSITSHLKLF